MSNATWVTYRSIRDEGGTVLRDLSIGLCAAVAVTGAAAPAAHADFVEFFGYGASHDVAIGFDTPAATARCTAP